MYLIRHQINPPDRILSTSRDICIYFTHFQPVSLSFSSKILTDMKLTTCSLDFIHTKFFKEVLNTVRPSLLSIFNSSLIHGVFPSAFKHAAVHPLLKKPKLDPSDFNNFRPVSKLPFLSEVLEKVVSSQLLSFMAKHNLFEKISVQF